MKENKKNNVVVMVIAIATLLIAVIGATYAYFQSQIGSGATANVTLTTKTTDSVTFSTGSAITIGPVTQQNFASGSGNKSNSTTATATFRANNNATVATNTYCYQAYLTISSNNFVYSTAPTNTPELTLTVTKTVNSGSATTIVNAKDITTGTTTVYFPTALNGSNYKHTFAQTAAGGLETDEFNVTVTFVNLGSDQQSNTGKTFSGVIHIDSVAC